VERLCLTFLLRNGRHTWKNHVQKDGKSFFAFDLDLTDKAKQLYDPINSAGSKDFTTSKTFILSNSLEIDGRTIDRVTFDRNTPGSRPLTNSDAGSKIDTRATLFTKKESFIQHDTPRSRMSAAEVAVRLEPNVMDVASPDDECTMDFTGFGPDGKQRDFVAVAARPLPGARSSYITQQTTDIATLVSRRDLDGCHGVSVKGELELWMFDKNSTQVI